MQLSAPWSSDEVSAVGQVFEFRLWALLTEQSRGLLHVFLPLSDRGIDALVHRLTDGAYIPVQAKSRSSLVDGEVHLLVRADSLRDDNALLIGGLVTEGGLGSTMLVISEGEFKRLASLTSDRGVPELEAEFGMHPRSDSRWLPWLAPTENVVSLLGVAPAAIAATPSTEPRPEWRSDIGFLGEAEVVRQLAVSGDLNLFRPFPDSETAEIAALHVESRRVVGLQVKTVEVDAGRMRATVDLYEPSFRAAPTTYLLVLAWRRDQSCFHEQCLLIPTVDLRSFARSYSGGHLTFEFRPGARRDDPVGRFQIRLDRLDTFVRQVI